MERREEEAGWATGPRGEGEGKLGPRVSCGLGRAGTGIWAGSLLFSLSFSFPYSNTTQIYLNSNSNLNSTLTLKPIKEMLQHECTNILTL